MALRSNSKKALENIYNYIREYSADYLTDNYGTDAEAISSKRGLYTAIYNTFREEMRPECPYYRRQPEQKVFADWAAGLAMGGLFCYYYNREAAADLATILEQTEEERAKLAKRYSETDAEQTLTYLIYREIKKEV